jgi:magnesium-transporting ATPase (P-type)
MMHRRLILLALAAVYYCIAIFSLLIFEAQILVTSVVLFGIPAYALARFSLAPLSVILMVALVGAGVGVLLEALAHVYGLWYTAGVNVAKLFGIIPIEGVLAITLQIVFLTLVYETMFDDGVYNLRNIHKRILLFVGVGIAFMVFAWGSIAISSVFFIESVYVWLLILLALACFVLLFIYRAFTVQLLDRIVLFTIIAIGPLLGALLVAVVNVQKVFAFTGEYVYSFAVLGEIIPLEEVLLLFILPLLVATVYELYLDDQA